ncbi:peptidoglycan DD-metalloendopeptidase family protein [Acuticoccus sp. M5D2P5]|uniref:murein hydrolase activator EnvC family protein n=1 Tax=Acuticoccus kalidii TaxID=2910977 RepID=UPI001F2E858E|nr:peptidoglycan DD-metalloendopeptidase family protein [Acuticoccus kalidii]MCF3935446.1 peptidoglycan DD-metalloendopeptidase family protein [Acuticoccus kalidii]
MVTRLSVLPFLLAVCLAAAVAAHAQDAAAPAAEDEAGAIARERQQLLTRLDRLREQTEATEARAKSLSDALVDLSGDEAKLRQRQEETAAKVSDLEQRISDEEVALEQLTDDQAAIRHRLAAKREELATVLMALQRLGRRPPPALFAGNDGAIGTVRGAILLNTILPSLDDEARALVTTLSEAARLAADERQRWNELRQDLASLQTERQRLSELGEELERRRAISVYERERAAADLARLAEEEGSVAALLDRLTREQAPQPLPPNEDFVTRRGNLAIPVAGQIVSEYGDPTQTGALSEGITIAALPQSTVISPSVGNVLFSSPFRGYGHVLIIDAGDGYHMVLAGLEETSVAPGDQIETGTPLGRMGRSSRRSTVASAGVKGSALLQARPALYVELRKDGAAIDSHGWWRDETAVEIGRTGG